MKIHRVLLPVLATAILLVLTSTEKVRASVPQWFWNGLLTHISDSDSRFAALEAQVAQHQADIALASTLIGQLQISLLNANDDILALQIYTEALEQYLAVDTTTDPARPKLLVTGANLQIVNGSNSTATANGVGNLIVGYDEERTFGAFTCSEGQYQDIAGCLGNGGTWAQGYKSGSHNVVVGRFHNYSKYGGVVAGELNTINRHFANVQGGYANVASGSYSSVSGGERNTASGDYSNVSSGIENSATGEYASILGGVNNTASGARSSVSSGLLNISSGLGSSVSGGWSNEASGTYSTVGGGFTRSVSGTTEWRAGSLNELQ